MHPGSALPVLAMVLATVLASPAVADGGEPERGFCRNAPGSLGDLARSDASVDLYNGLLWFAGAGVVGATAGETTRWTRRNAFDDGIRDGLRFGSASSRGSAKDASDAFLGASLAIPSLGVAYTWLGERDCEKAYDMATDFAESVGLTLFLIESTKAISGRRRPPQSGTNAARSFFSGHASLAATAAGLTCAQSIRRNAWGESGAARVTPCVLGVAAALGAGVFRVGADLHWGSDVLVGWTVGGLVGWFDTWGPFDLLRFQIEKGDGGPPARGIVLPAVVDGAFGARVSVRY